VRLIPLLTRAATILNYLLACCTAILFEHLHLVLVSVAGGVAIGHATFLRYLIVTGDAVGFGTTKAALLPAHLVDDHLLLLVVAVLARSGRSLTTISLHALPA